MASNPKFCCGEMIYTNICPYCEKRAGDMRFGSDDNEDGDDSGANKHLVEVNEGGGWGSGMSEGDAQSLNFDELFGGEDE